LRQKKPENIDVVELTGLQNTGQDQVIFERRLSEAPVGIPPVLREAFDRVLCVVVVPWNTVCACFEKTDIG
jgi:hypothetical protein